MKAQKKKKRGVRVRRSPHEIRQVNLHEPTHGRLKIFVTQAQLEDKGLTMEEVASKAIDFFLDVTNAKKFHLDDAPAKSAVGFSGGDSHG